MNRLMPRCAFAVVTFALGLTLTSLKDSRSTKCDLVELEVSISNDFEIPTVTVCSLIKEPSTYEGRLVRVHAVFAHDAGQVNLREVACGKSLHSGFSNSYESNKDLEKALSVYTGLGS